jgi:hypothetical protein
VAKQEKLPPGPYYEPVTSWREIALWLSVITVLIVVAGLLLVYVM